MKNKKGFTLIELLAVIVILAIIMVIAVPQILKVIDESRTASWKNSVKMVEKAIELEASLIKPESTTSISGGLTKVSDICSGNPALSTIVDLGDMTLKECATSGDTSTFKFDGKGQFGSKKAKIVCTVSTGSCTNDPTTY